MKLYNLSIVSLFTLCVTAQVGIGTTNPNEMLEVNGSIRMTDGNQADGKLLVSDANGSASWENVTDGVKTEVIRQINGGASTTVTLWTHPEEIAVLFNPSTETLTVKNNSGNSTNYWDIVSSEGSKSNNVVKDTQYNYRFITDNGTNFNHDLDGDPPPPPKPNRGWFTIVASDQNNQKDGFIMHIIYFDDDFNGTVQYWDN